MPDIFTPDAIAKAVRDLGLADPGEQAQRPVSHPSMVGPMAATIGGNVADIATTLSALRGGNAVEANPIMRAGGTAGMVGMKAAATLLELLAERALAKRGHPTAAKWLGYGIGGGMGALAAHNMTVGRK